MRQSSSGVGRRGRCRACERGFRCGAGTLRQFRSRRATLRGLRRCCRGLRFVRTGRVFVGDDTVGDAGVDQRHLQGSVTQQGSDGFTDPHHAAVTALVGFFVGLTDPTYYEPETFLDYSAAIMTTGSAIATAVALWVWGSAQDRRVPIVKLVSFSRRRSRCLGRRRRAHDPLLS
jgi:hypothetical protein